MIAGLANQDRTEPCNQDDRSHDHPRPDTLKRTLDGFQSIGFVQLLFTISRQK